jgi:hypothetical protein
MDRRNVLPADQHRMTATSLIGWDHDRTVPSPLVCGRQLHDDLGIDARVIGRQQQPGVGYIWSAMCLEPGQAMCDGVAHFHGIVGELEQIRAGRCREQCQVAAVRSYDYYDALHARLLDSAADYFKDSAAAEG